MPTEMGNPAEPRMIPWKFLLAPLVGNPDSQPGMTELQAHIETPFTGAFTELESAVVPPGTTVPIGYPIPSIPPRIVPTRPERPTILQPSPCTFSCGIECKHTAFFYGTVPTKLAQEYVGIAKGIARVPGDELLAAYGRDLADYLTGQGIVKKNPQWPACVDKTIRAQDRVNWSWTQTKNAIRQMLGGKVPSTTYFWRAPQYTAAFEPCTISVRICALIITVIPGLDSAAELNDRIYNLVSDPNWGYGPSKLKELLEVFERGNVALALLWMELYCRILNRVGWVISKEDAKNEAYVQRLLDGLANSLNPRWERMVSAYRSVLSVDPVKIRENQLRWDAYKHDVARAAAKNGTAYLEDEARRFGLAQSDIDEIIEASFLKADLIADLNSNEWGRCPRVQIPEAVAPERPKMELPTTPEGCPLPAEAFDKTLISFQDLLGSEGVQSPYYQLLLKLGRFEAEHISAEFAHTLIDGFTAIILPGGWVGRITREVLRGGAHTLLGRDWRDEGLRSVSRLALGRLLGRYLDDIQDPIVERVARAGVGGLGAGLTTEVIQWLSDPTNVDFRKSDRHGLAFYTIPKGKQQEQCCYETTFVWTFDKIGREKVDHTRCAATVPFCLDINEKKVVHIGPLPDRPDCFRIEIDYSKPTAEALQNLAKEWHERLSSELKWGEPGDLELNKAKDLFFEARLKAIDRDAEGTQQLVDEAFQKLFEARAKQAEEKVGAQRPLK